MKYNITNNDLVECLYNLKAHQLSTEEFHKLIPSSIRKMLGYETEWSA